MTSTIPTHIRTNRVTSATIRWQPYALAGIVALLFLLYGWDIGSEGWGNSFYSAAVHSMSENVTNFLFGALDPVGVVTVDKPPMANWAQVVSAWIFGYHGWALLLPQVFEGAAAVFLLHRTVRQWMGEHTALLAALILALTPITVAINRDNNPDTLLTLLCVAAAYAVTRSLRTETSRSATLWLCQAALWIGCGFVTKMLAGWMIIPAIGLAYLAGRDTGWGRRLLDLVAAGVVLVAASLWWVALTALWPAPKPFIGGSDNGGAWNLIIGYNGLGRIFGEHPDAPSKHAPRITRLFSGAVGGQITWLFPLCALVLLIIIVSVLRKHSTLTVEQRAGWILWGVWLVVLGFVFSTQQGIFHSYYTTQLAPAVAALSAAGIVVLWRYYRHSPGYGWLLLPSAIAITAIWAWILISRDIHWNGWLRYAVAAVAVIAIAMLIADHGDHSVKYTGLVFGIVALLLAPTIWSAASAFDSGNRFSTGSLASAGPSGAYSHKRSRKHNGGAKLSALQRKILSYVDQHSAGARVTLAVEGGAHGAEPYLINSGSAVVGMGGFSGNDNAPSVQQLTEWKTQHQLAFIMEPGGKHHHKVGNTRTDWVKQNCTAVPAHEYDKNKKPDSGTLYRCG